MRLPTLALVAYALQGDNAKAKGGLSGFRHTQEDTDQGVLILRQSLRNWKPFGRGNGPAQC